MDKDPDKSTEQSSAGIEVIKKVIGKYYQKTLQITPSVASKNTMLI